MSKWSSLLKVIPNKADIKKRLLCSVLVDCKGTQSQLCYLLSKQPVKAIGVGKAGEFRWAVRFFNERERDNFVLKCGKAKSDMGDISYEVVDKIYYYDIKVPAVVGLDELVGFFVENFKESDIVKVEPVLSYGIYTSTIRVAIRRKIDIDIRIGGKVKCWCDETDSNGTKMEAIYAQRTALRKQARQ